MSSTPPVTYVSKVYTVAFQGIEALEVNVEVQMTPGLPAFSIVGLADKAVAESRERIRACFQSIGLGFPPKRIIVNLAPADIQKEGTHYDLPIALGLLGSMEVIEKESLTNILAMGELGLDGRIARTQGVLPSAVLAHQKEYVFVCPSPNYQEASWSGYNNILHASDLMSLIRYFRGEIDLTPLQEKPKTSTPSSPHQDFSDIKGQPLAKRAFEIAAAGGHHVLLVGPPGVGKSMMARRLGSILPALSPKEALEVTMLYSLAGLLPETGLITQRPFRDPHHSASHVALVGGGHRSKPGEISLAHRGVLFLDELPEFSRIALESLRQPLETRHVTIARANHHVTYPAFIQLIAAMNPCRCGFYSDPTRQCAKVPQCATDYAQKISGPLMDRFDLVVHLDDVTSSDLMGNESYETSEVIAKRVKATREMQSDRYRDKPIAEPINAAAEGRVLMEECACDDKAQSLLAKAIDRFRLSARGYHRVIRVARTIADLEGDTTPHLKEHHIAEALSYRKVSG